MNSEKSYYRKLILFSSVLFLVSYLFSRYAPPALVSDYLIFIVPFFFIMTVLTRVFTKHKKAKDPKKSLALYLGASGIKLFIYLAILIAYGLLNRNDAPAFFISFFVFYLVYTFIEVKLELKISH
jgi:F0F1-type ATP synthase assembly protein I